MNKRQRLSAILALGSSLAVAACSPAASSAPPLEGAAIGGAYTLTDQNGARFDSAQLRGKYPIVYFGFSYCPDVCPVDLQHIGQALRLLEREDPALAAKLQPVFITTDPERDRPAVLKEYVSAFHPRLIGLTGSPQEIATVAKAHGVWFSKQETEGSSEYVVDHSRIAFLFGPDGKPIAILPHEQGAEAIAAELKKWVR